MTSKPAIAILLMRCYMERMQIISGRYRGRTLHMIEGKAIRPTSARVRESLFNILNHRTRADGTSLMQGARFADLYCGSGAVGCEALSHGAAIVHFVDHAQQSMTIARKNVAQLGATDQTTYTLSPVTEVPNVSEAYDIMFLDPPYDRPISEQLFTHLAQQGWLNEHSIIIIEVRRNTPPHAFEALELTDERRYGQSLLRFYQYDPTLPVPNQTQSSQKNG